MAMMKLKAIITPATIPMTTAVWGGDEPKSSRVVRGAITLSGSKSGALSLLPRRAGESVNRVGRWVRNDDKGKGEVSQCSGALQGLK